MIEFNTHCSMTDVIRNGQIVGTIYGRGCTWSLRDWGTAREIATASSWEQISAIARTASYT